MEKQTKNIITKETILRELKLQNAQLIRLSTVLTVVSILILAPLSILLLKTFWSNVDEDLLSAIWCLITAAILLMPVVGFICFLFPSSPNQSRSQTETTL